MGLLVMITESLLLFVGTNYTSWWPLVQWRDQRTQLCDDVNRDDSDCWTVHTYVDRDLL